MKKTTVMRSLRILHKISLRELADAANVSVQYISKVELGNSNGKNLKLMQKAFETLIHEKGGQLDMLMKSYADNKDHLLEIEMLEDIL